MGDWRGDLGAATTRLADAISTLETALTAERRGAEETVRALTAAKAAELAASQRAEAAEDLHRRREEL